MLTDRDGPPPPDNPDDHGMIPLVVPPLPVVNPHARDLPVQTAFDWLKAGWRDLWTQPVPSLLYGLCVAVISDLVVWLLFHLELDYALFPALAGFLVVGPLVANGLYRKSQALERGEKVRFRDMIFVKMESFQSAFFMGVLLLGLFLLWMRAAVLIWALFFGIQPFPGTEDIVSTLFFTRTGWALLVVGSLVGALFASFAFAISVFAVPMLLEEKTDALSALGISMAMVWNNLPVMLVWGAIVLVLVLISIATAMLGFIIVFPVLGHATWHAYRSLRPTDRQSGTTERMFIQPA